MKVGDNIPVAIGGHTVAQARVAELGDGKATLVVPGTVVVMAVRTELDGAARDTSGTETIVTGVDRPANNESAEGTQEVVNASSPDEAAAATDETPSDVESAETVPVKETHDE